MNQSVTPKQQKRIDFVDLIEAVTYVVCHENAVSSESFFSIFSSPVVAKKIMATLCKDSLSQLEVGDLSSFVMSVTLNPEFQLSSEVEDRLRRVFRENVGDTQKDMNLEEFKRIVPVCKRGFFTKRIFNIFDVDKDGKVSLKEFIHTMQQFSHDDDDTKIAFLFHVYDTDGDGVLQKEDIYEVLQACLTENGLDVEENHIQRMGDALFMDGCKEGRDHLTLDDFKEQLHRHEGLNKNLGIMIHKWLVPPKPEKKRSIKEKLKDSLPLHVMTKEYWSENLRLWILFIFVANLIIMTERAVYYRNFSMLSGAPNFFYMISRACGKALLFNCVLVLLLVLRLSITTLRRFGLSKILPLDNHIYIHKVTGITIFVLALVHSICHLFNFAINIQPNPIKFVQMNYDYWRVHYGLPADSNVTELVKVMYTAPDGCTVTKDYPEGSIPEYRDMTIATPSDEWHWQVCEESEPWTYADWMLTDRPKALGLIGGFANPTGLTLLVILTTIFICALPFIRRTGHFHVFYFTHLLYWAFFPLLILHAPEYWIWIIVPGLIWLVEMTIRLVMMCIGAGNTTIKAGVILPSKVTNLVIQRPPGFNFSAGDWVFIKIPAVASHEWHPFTISSAPEVHGHFTLHIRSVGQWTTTLHNLIKEEHERMIKGLKRKEPTYNKIQGSIRRKVQSVKHFVTQVSEDENHKDDFADYFAHEGHLGEPTSRPPLMRNGGSIETKDSTNNVETFQHTLRRRRKVCDHNDNGEKQVPANNGQQILRERVPLEKSTSGPSARRSAIPTYIRPLSLQSKIVIYDDAEVEDDGETEIQSVSVHGENSARLQKPLQVFVDGPFGSPSSNIYRAEHAVLVGTGIGVTPFASILQSIIHRYLEIKRTCPNCNYSWTSEINTSMFNLRKVDFIWINREQKSFEWFVSLLSQLEAEQREQGGEMSDFLEMHMYVTSALQRTDMKAVALQMALDILHKKEDKDLLTGLKARTNPGRPNWDKVFTRICEENRGKVTIFYCGNPHLAKTLKAKCASFGFNFRKEVF